MAIIDYKVGDILLINNKSKAQKYNILAQRFIRKTLIVNATHVALSLGNGIFIHADARTGVDIVFFADILGQSNGNWRVIRPSFINAGNEECLKKEAIYHFSKAYNYGFLKQGKKNALFCSEFVDKVFESIGFNLFEREKLDKKSKFTNAFPVDFERLLDNSLGWNDVSEIYRKGLTDNTFDMLRNQYSIRKSMVIISQRHNAASEGIINLLKKMLEMTDLIPEAERDNKNIMDIKCAIKEIEQQTENRLYRFWNEKNDS